MLKPACLAIVAALLAGCGQSDTATTSAPGQNPVNAPTDYLGAVAKAKKTAEGTVDVSALGQAISMFQVEKGRNPTNLNELVTSGQMSKLPEPPYNMKFEYDATKGTVKIVAK